MMTYKEFKREMANPIKGYERVNLANIRVENGLARMSQEERKELSRMYFEYLESEDTRVEKKLFKYCQRFGFELFDYLISE